MVVDGVKYYQAPPQQREVDRKSELSLPNRPRVGESDGRLSQEFTFPARFGPILDSSAGPRYVEERLGRPPDRVVHNRDECLAEWLSPAYDAQVVLCHGKWTFKEVATYPDEYSGTSSLTLAEMVYELEDDLPVWSTRAELTRFLTTASYLPRKRGTRGGLDSQLNGANGEVTGKDDVKPKARSGQKTLNVDAVMNKLEKLLVAKSGSSYIDKAAAKRLGRAALKKGGGALAGSVAAYVGADPMMQAAAARAGTKGGAWLSRLVGWGIVHAEKNNFQGVKSNSILRNFSPGATFGTQRMTMSRREKVMDIYANAISGSTPVIYTVPLQPGIVGLFRHSWGASASFSCYKVDGAVLEFESLLGDIMTSGPIGACTIATDFNPSRAAPTSADALEGLDDCFSFKLSESCGYAVECDPRRLPLGCYMVRSGPLSTGQNLNDYDQAVVYLAVEPGSVTAGSLLGKLYMTWCVTFDKPSLSSYRPGHLRITRSGVANSTPFGTNTVTSILSGVFINATISTTTLSLGFIPPGVTIIGSYNVTGTSVTTSAPTRTYTNFSTVNMLSNSSTHEIASTTGAASTSYMLQFSLVTNGSNVTIPLITLGTGGTLPTSATCDIIIESIGTNVTLGSTA